MSERVGEVERLDKQGDPTKREIKAKTVIKAERRLELGRKIGLM